VGRTSSLPGAAAARRRQARSETVRGDDRGLTALAAQIASALVLSVAGGAAIAVTGDWKIALGLLVGAMFVGLGLLQPALFVAVLLTIRPLLDGQATTVSQLLGVLLIGVCALVFATQPRLVRPRAIIAFSALLLISALASLPALMEFRSIIGMRPLTELVRLAALFSMYLLAAQVVTTPEALRRVFVIVGLSGVLPAISAINELVNHPEQIKILGLVRVSGTFVNPVALSSYLALCILLVLTLSNEDLSRRVRWGALGIMIPALIASYGREGWILLLLALVLLNWRRRKRFIAGVAIACTGFVLLVPGVQARVLPSADPSGSEKSTFASYDWRISNWTGLIQEYEQKPLTGWGLKTTEVVNPRRPFGSQRNSDGGFQAHNAAVRALVEGGVLLLGAVLAFFAAMIATLWRIARSASPQLAGYARVLAAGWLAMFVVAVSTDDLLDATALVYAMLALTGALEGVHRRMTTDSPPPADLSAYGRST
jgi:O-antigen ligase